MVITIIEDPSGIIWFGTYGNGLVSYDPHSGNYSVYRHDPADSGSLSNDVVHRLFVDHKGTLWIGTQGGGLNALDPGSHRFRKYYAGTDSTPGQYYLSISEDQAGLLWLATGRSGLQHFDPATGRITPVQGGWQKSRRPAATTLFKPSMRALQGMSGSVRRMG